MPVDFNTLHLKVEGYPSKLSYLPGEEITFHCSAQTETFTAEIAHIGAGRTVVWCWEGIPGRSYPAPTHAYATGCDWPVAFALRVPDS